MDIIPVVEPSIVTPATEPIEILKARQVPLLREPDTNRDRPFGPADVHRIGYRAEPPEIIQPLSYTCSTATGYMRLEVDPVNGTAWFDKSSTRYFLIGENSISAPRDNGTLMLWRVPVGKHGYAYRYRIFSENMLDLKTDIEGWCSPLVRRQW